MIKKICFVLSLVFVLTLLVGCVAGITTAGQKLGRAEDQASVPPTGQILSFDIDPEPKRNGF